MKPRNLIAFPVSCLLGATILLITLSPIAKSRGAHGMSRNPFVRAIIRATADLVTISTMAPVAFLSYLSYKLALYLILISFHSLMLERGSEIADGLKQLIAEVKAEGLEAVKSRLARALPWHVWPSLRWSSLKAKLLALIDSIDQFCLSAYVHLRQDHLPSLRFS